MLRLSVLAFATIAVLGSNRFLQADCPWELLAGASCEEAHGPWVAELNCNCKTNPGGGGSPKICDRLIAFSRSPQPQYSNFVGGVAEEYAPDGGSWHEATQIDYYCGVNQTCSQGNCLNNPLTGEWRCPVLETQELVIDADIVFDSCSM